MKFLVADIGGTNARFAIYDKKILWKTTLPVTGLFITALKKILSHKRAKNITKACFACAGPISHNGTRCKLTNAPWQIDTKQLIKRTTLKKIILINDFEAIGYAVNDLKHLTLKWLYKKLPIKPSRIAIIGAGTGLGHSLVLKHKYYKPYPSEGGKCPFFVERESDLVIYKYLAKKPIIEDVVSGRGLVNVYNALTNSRAPHDPAQLMSHYKTDPKVRTAFAMFERYYGYAARNYCYYILPQLLFIAGGIAEQNKRIFGPNFKKAFHESRNAELRKYLKTIPIALITDPDVGLKGAAWLARHS